MNIFADVYFPKLGRIIPHLVILYVKGSRRNSFSAYKESVMWLESPAKCSDAYKWGCSLMTRWSMQLLSPLTMDGLGMEWILKAHQGCLIRLFLLLQCWSTFYLFPQGKTDNIGKQLFCKPFCLVLHKMHCRLLVLQNKLVRARSNKPFSQLLFLPKGEKSHPGS